MIEGVIDLTEVAVLWLEAWRLGTGFVFGKISWEKYLHSFQKKKVEKNKSHA